MTQYKVIGLMSGTSLDGLDIAATTFYKEGESWRYDQLIGKTAHYSEELLHNLKEPDNMSAEELCFLNNNLAEFHALEVQKFINESGFEPDLIASHGHTIFHRPNDGMTFQAGNAAVLKAMLGKKIIYDFRSLDVALGGQGAPLVPGGEWYLFKDFSGCLNLGGIANISDLSGEQPLAKDLCFCNMLMNRLAEREALLYDEDGKLASEGDILEDLLSEWIKTQDKLASKGSSLAREQMAEIFDLIPGHSRTEDLLRTAIAYLVHFIAKAVEPFLESNSKVLVSGGGTHNDYLVKELEKKMPGINWVFPDKELIDYKEALIFGFLAVLKSEEITNVFKSVTGASRDQCAGTIIL